MRGPCLVAVLLAAIASSSATASVVRVDFSGHVDYGGDPDYTAVLLAQQQSSLGFTIPDGTQFSGFFTFDDGVAPTPVVNPAPEESNYLFLIPDWTLETTVGPLSTRPGPPPDGDYFVIPPTSDGYHITAFSGLYDSGVVIGNQVRGSTSGGPAPDPLFFQLDLQGGAPFGPTVLADVPWDLAAYTSAAAVWTFDPDGGPTIEIHGVIDGLVPEPAAAALAALVPCLALIRLLRARSRTSSR